MKREEQAVQAMSQGYSKPLSRPTVIVWQRRRRSAPTLLGAPRLQILTHNITTKVALDGKCFSVQGQSEAQALNFVLKRFILTLRLRGNVTARLPPVASWSFSSGSSVHLAATMPADSTERLSTRIEASAPVFDYCPGDISLTLSSPSLQVPVTWLNPIVVVEGTPTEVNETAIDKRNYSWHELPLTTTEAVVDVEGRRAVCIIRVKATNAGWNKYAVGYGTVALSTFRETLDFSDGTCMLPLATTTEPGAFRAVAGLPLADVHVYQWQFDAPLNHTFQFGTDDVSLELRATFAVSTNLPPFAAVGAFLRVEFVDPVANAKVTGKVDASFENWLDNKPDLTSVNSNMFSLAASGVVPATLHDTRFSAVRLSLVMPVGVPLADNVSTEPLTLLPMSISFGFHTMKSALNKALPAVAIVSNDRIAPTIVCPKDVAAQSNGDGERVEIPLNSLQPTTMLDDSGFVELLTVLNTSYASGVHDIELVAADAAGNTASCGFRIVVSGLTSSGSSSPTGMGSGATAGIVVSLLLALMLVAALAMRRKK